MVKVTEIIVLHTTKSGDDSIVIHTLSKEYGRRGFLVRGVGKKSVTALLQPLSIIEAEIHESTKSKLYMAKSLTARYALNGIRNDLYKNSMTMFMSEVLYRTVKDGAMEPGLFEWCEKNILLLDAIESDFSNFHIRWLLEFAVTLGFSPEAGDLMPFTGAHYPIVERFMGGSFADTMLIPVSGQIRNEIAEGILRYIEFHTESAINVNSLKVLRELFS
ncbi:MAG: recombination protein O N-terminal domain-containing protein [Bacteroidales bacterium]|nr:recombination protein O N-terminal domain-containing protein [Bacteroidales bacterium]